MPRFKDYTISIPAIYKRKYEDIAMFFWVEGIRSKIPACTIEQAIYEFFKYIGEEGNIESALSCYTRLKRDFYASTKTRQ